MKLEREKIVPQLRQKKKVDLFPAKGRTLLISDFVEQNIARLSPSEIKIVRSVLQELIAIVIPYPLSCPLAVSKDIAVEGSAWTAQPVGSRSAYLPKEQLKLKGCRPTKKLYFPHARLDFGKKHMTMEKIRFGSLSAENVIREILAFCFFKVNAMPILHTPACVFEYDIEGELTYCLVSRTPTELRLESNEEFYGLTIRDLILLRGMENEFAINVLPKEIEFRGVDMAWYARTKGAVYAQMNIRGGFRGIFNSNLGNDLVYRDQFYICDYDTFKVIEIPKNPSEKFILDFIAWCVAEILKTSPYVLDYADVDKLSKKETAQVLWRAYSSRSSLWRHYWQCLLQLTENRGWDVLAVKKSLNTVLHYEVIYDLLLDNVLNSNVLKNTYQPEMSFYVPHNY